MANDIETYTLETIESDDIPPVLTYYVSFIDGAGTLQREQVSQSVFNELCKDRKIARKLVRSDERHIERSEQFEGSINKKQIRTAMSPEDIVIGREFVYSYRMALQKLPVIQRRRYVLYTELGYTFDQVSAKEGCSIRAIKYSIDIAKNKMQIFLKKFEN